MGIKKSILHAPILVLATTALLACSGLAGGGATGGSLDNPGNSGNLGGNVGTGPGALGTAQVQSVPSTQQSEPGIGAPCGYGFIVKVKISRGGSEQSCSDPSTATATATGTLVSARMVDVTGDLAGEATEMAPPEDFGPGPVVTFKFRSQNDSEDQVKVVKTVCSPEGIWQTELGSIIFRANPHYDGGLHCPTYTASAQAKLGSFSSNLLSGPPFPDSEDAAGPVPVVVTIDLPFRPTDGVVSPKGAVLAQ